MSRGEAAADKEVAFPVRVAAAWSWRILVIVGAIALFFYLMTFVSTLAIAFMVAILFAALLSPVVTFLRTKWKMGRTGAAVVGLVFGLVIVLIALTVALTQVLQQFPLIVEQSVKGVERLLDWASTGPLGLESTAIQEWLQDVQGSVTGLLSKYGSVIASGALTFASTTFSLLTGSIIMLFTLFFLMRDGRSMWIIVVRCIPSKWQNAANEAGIRGWVTLGVYVRTQSKVAAIDALGIGIGAWALGVPLAVPIMVLVFLFAYIPIVGAFVSGGVAVLIALVNNGLEAGIIMFLVVLLVQQLEGNVLQPWLMAHAVALHPVSVLFAVAAGGMVAGIAGAVFSVPVLAFLNVVILYLTGHDPYPSFDEKPDRPGGAPGTLDEQIAASYARGRKDESRVAQKVRQKAQERAELKGHILGGSVGSAGIKSSGISVEHGESVPLDDSSKGEN